MGLKRTKTCGELRAADAGARVVLGGWVDSWRDHGGIRFLNLRDRYGVTQVVVDESSPQEAHDIAADLARRVLRRGGRHGAPAPRRDGQRGPGHRRDRAGRDADRGAVHLRPAAVRDRRHDRRARGAAPDLPLPGPALRRHAAQPGPAQRRHRRGARGADRPGLSGDRDTHHGALHPGRGARLHRAVTGLAGTVLRVCRSHRRSSSSS